MNVEFREPLLLLVCLAAIPVFVVARAAVGRLRFSSLRLLPDSAKTWRARMVWLPDLILALAVVAFGVALAGPRTAGGTTRVEREGIAIMMVVDRSGSMRALDLSPPGVEMTRLDVVIDVFEKFVMGDGNALEGRADDAVGLVSFAGYPDALAPLTLDHNSLVDMAQTVEIANTREEDGTAIGDGLELAVLRLKTMEAESKVVILLTDGVNNAGETPPLEAAELAKTMGIKVFTVGAGTRGLAKIRIEDPRTGNKVLREVAVQIDEETLQKIADKTGGRYFRATDASSLEAVYKQIDDMVKSRITEDRRVRYEEYFEHATALGLLLAIFGWLLSATVFRRLP